MDIGSLLAIFLAVAVVLLALLCLIIKCFSLRLLKQKQNVVDRYFESSEVDWNEEPGWDGAYHQFCNYREQKRKATIKESLLEEDYFMQEIKNKALLDLTDQIYTPTSVLHRKLTADIQLSPVKTTRSFSHFNDFKFERINTPSPRQKSHSEEDCYKFTKQLICYNRQGLHFIEIVPLSFSRNDTEVVLQKTVYEHWMQPSQSKFEDLLQSCGYTLFGYGYSRLVCQIAMDQLKNDQIYNFKNLETRQLKEIIDEELYNKLKDELKDQI